MNFVEFSNVTFAYPMIAGDLDENGNQIVPEPIFKNFSGGFPEGFTSLIGPNGSGKSTLMMLSSGRLLPQSGSVKIFGKDTQSLNEEQKNLLASVIYQNMEFESEDSVETLLNFVYKNGAYKGKEGGINSADLLDETIEVFDLKKVMRHGLTKISKGENQRVLLAFSLLYGSKSVFMDEPFFAMEDSQKHAALKYLKEFCAKKNVSIYVSMHELDLTRTYADNVILIKPNRDIVMGTPKEVMTNEELESAYKIPASMLKNHEDMTREKLNNISSALNSSK